MPTAMLIITLMNAFSPGTPEDVISEMIIAQRTDFVARQQPANFIRDRGGVIRPVALHEKDRGFVSRPGHFLERGHHHKKPRAFAVLDDSRQMEIVLQHVQHLPDFHFSGSRVDIVDQDVVGILEIVTLENGESARHRAKRIRLDAVDDFQAVHGIELARAPARPTARMAAPAACSRWRWAWARR